MIDPKALEKLIKNGYSIVSFTNDDYFSAKLIRDARVEPDGRVSFETTQVSRLVEYLQDTDAFTLSVLLSYGSFVRHIDTLLCLDTDRYVHVSKAFESEFRAIDEGCANAIISCKIDRIVRMKEIYRVFGTVVESRLFIDRPSMTENDWEHFLEGYAIYTCDRCGQEYILSSDEKESCYCGGRLWRTPLKEYRKQHRIT